MQIEGTQAGERLIASATVTSAQSGPPTGAGEAQAAGVRTAKRIARGRSPNNSRGDDDDPSALDAGLDATLQGC